ncbi:MAG: glutamine--fructose-6-phosphate transaminase (isomerizing) [Candidatus Nanoarchaeia archaeon]|nr:glutamine--fructose-6-phosphate transaminase (isomerizing) [Candidatus Nanoarchaeia archaeon]
MCGIIAYKGKDKAISVILEGLKNLEYRGYDSWGIACKSNPSIVLTKGVGNIGEVTEEEIKSELYKGKPLTIGIGHTRWATHGGVTKENAHPHQSENHRVAVVHNGIIENFEELKAKLKNIKFKSETDTEVIPQLLQYHMESRKDFEKAFVDTLKELQGNYAVVAIDQQSDKVLFGKVGSPLVIGKKEDEYFVASDIPAFLKHTNQVIYLEDGEYGSIGDSLKIYKLSNNQIINKDVQTVDWNLEQAQKGEYPHFMIKEIMEQRDSITRALEQKNSNLLKVIEMMKKAKGIFLVGCGTSFHACVSASYNFSHIAKAHVNIVLASEFRNYEEFLTDESLMIAVSQSGETADLIDAVKVAKAKGVKIISLVNVMGSTLKRMSDESLLMNAGPEICVCSTKNYTSQLAILLLLAYGFADRLEEGKELIQSAANKVEELIKNNLDKIKDLAKKLKDNKNMFLIGRDLAYPSALEGALKIKEVSYIHAEGFAGGELKHGTIALIEEGTPVITLATPETEQLINSNAIEIKSRGGYIIGIGSKKHEVYDFYIEVPNFKQANPLLMIVPIQLLAYYLAVERNCNPDKPRNLAKSVTVR